MRAIIKLIFGKKCEFCNRNNFRVCPKCLSKISSLKMSQNNIPYFLSYQDEKIRKLIWKFKYKNEYEIAKDLAPLIADFITENLEDNISHQNSSIFIVPAPITNDPSRYRLKNHMLIMAKEVNELLNKKGFRSFVADCVEKKTNIRSVMILGKKKRVRHIKESLSLKTKAPEEGFVFIIDDVTTTGATLLEIKKLISTKKALVQTVALAH